MTNPTDGDIPPIQAESGSSQGDAFENPRGQAVPPPKPKMNVEIAPIQRLYRAKDLLGDQYWLFFGIVFVGMLLGGLVPLGILMGPMLCGMFICYRQRMYGQRSSFDPLFKGFNFFGPSMAPVLIFIGLTILLIVPVWILTALMVAGVSIFAEANNSPGMSLMMFPLMLLVWLLVMFLTAAVYVPFTFAFPLIVDRGMPGMDAVKESWRMAKTRFFELYKMYLVYFVIYFVAAICCIIPAYLFLPILAGAIFTLYVDFYGLNPTPPPIEKTYPQYNQNP